jgi:glycosyltransferase involved in cell wall biosynthesis
MVASYLHRTVDRRVIMKLAVDTRSNTLAGVARYARSITRGLLESAAQAGVGVSVIADEKFAKELRPAIDARWLPLHEVVVCPDQEGFTRKSRWMRTFLAEAGIDLLYNGYYLTDLDCGLPFVPTIYDLTRLKVPGASYSDQEFRRRFGETEFDHIRDELQRIGGASIVGSVFQEWFRTANQRQVERAAHIIAVSSTTADDLVTILGADRRKITVIRSGVDTDIFRREDPAPGVEKHSPPQPYLLYVGQVGYHKRLDWLLTTLENSDVLASHGARLAVVGGFAEGSSQLQERVGSAAVRGLLTLTGRVTDEELARFYSGASALVVASLSEGNHLPPHEALSCGCEVIYPDVAALRETIGTHGHMYDPQSPSQFLDLVRAALEGRLPRRSTGYRPVPWPHHAAALLRTLRGVALHVSARS